MASISESNDEKLLKFMDNILKMLGRFSNNKTDQLLNGNNRLLEKISTQLEILTKTFESFSKDAMAELQNISTNTG